ncbi:M14 family metallopeptidase [bacterium]|nr:M14 family metallopeptidase [bacterium]
MTALPAVAFGEYYQHQELTEHLRQVAAAAPDRVRLHNIYTTPEGREEWLVEVTDLATGDPAARPGYLVQANVHAVEVSGTTASLVLIEQLLTDPAATALLGEVAFYIIPRVNPDGAEYALTTSGQIRSKYEYRPRKNGLVARDLNGDGMILSMRWQDPFGPYRADEEDPRLLLRRRAGDAGPFYQMMREGMIEDYDGGPIQEAVRGLDFNRNWAVNWQPEHLQYGAGDHAFSNPELKALADWVRDHPNVFAMLGFHNGCNAVLRPSATTADDEMNAADVRMMKEIGEIGERLTGFKLRAVRDYRCDCDKPISLKGHFTDWGYFGLGLSVYEIELGSVFNAAGITTDQYFGADEQTREVLFMRQVLKYATEQAEPGFVDWQPFDHPQLGPVEIGGLKSVFWGTPPPQALQTIGANCAEFILEHARRHPQLAIHSLTAEAVEGQVYRLQATVANTGGLPTQVTEHGSRVAANGPVTIRLVLGEGVTLLSRSGVVEQPSLPALSGHLDLEWFVRGPAGATVTVEAKAPKAGAARQSVQL